MKRLSPSVPHDPRAIDNYEGFGSMIKNYFRPGTKRTKSNSEDTNVKKIKAREGKEWYEYMYYTHLF